MLDSIGRLLALAFVVTTLTVLAVVFMRQVGLKQGYQPPPHPWYKMASWKVSAPSPDVLCAKNLPPGPESLILLVPVRKSSVGWSVTCQDSQVLKLEEFLKQTSQTKILLKVEPSDEPDLDNLVDITTQFEKSGKSFAAWAPAQKIARYLRRKAPQWLFASDSASLLRLHMFASLWMEPMIEFWPDFAVASDNLKDGSQLNDREAKELHRRFKRIIWDQTFDQSAAPNIPVDGVMTGRGPSELLK